MKLSRPAMLAAAALVAIPAGASAASVSGGVPIPGPGKQMLSLYADGKAKRDNFSINVSRRAPQQLDSFHMTGVRVMVRGNRATVRGSLGARGSINMRMNGGKAGRASLPRGCTGPRARTFTGHLTGVLRFRGPDGKVRTYRRIPAQIYAGDFAKLKCQGKRPGGGGEGDGGFTGGPPRLILAKELGAEKRWMFSAQRTSMEFIHTQPIRRPARSMHVTMLSASGANLLTVINGGAQAHVRAAGPFRGAGEFTSVIEPEMLAMGPLAGNLSIKPVGLPAFTITGDDATLINPKG